MGSTSLLYLGETPTVHVPSQEVRAWRELINCRGQIIAKRTRAKNAVRALLRSAGVTAPKNPGMWTKKGLAWLRRLDLPTTSQQLRRDLLLEEIETLIRQVRRIEQQLNRQARRAAGVALLRTIPGVGARTAEALAAFIDEPQRFRDAKAVGRYFGLVPSQDQSGDRNRHGASRRRWREWGRPHNVSWRPAAAGDAEWTSGKSRDRLALLVLTEPSSWMPDRRARTTTNPVCATEPISSDTPS